MAQLPRLLPTSGSSGSRTLRAERTRRAASARIQPACERLDERILLSTPTIAVSAGFAGAAHASILEQGVPPDTSMAAGPTAIVEGVNNDILIYSKTGKLISDVLAAQFFSKVNPAGNPFDPRILYDDITNRFIVTYVDHDEAKRTAGVLVAVSPGSDPTVPADQWAEQRIEQGPIAWADFPMVGYNANLIFVSVALHPNSAKDGPGNNEAASTDRQRVYAINNINTGRVAYDLELKQHHNLQPAEMHGAQPGGPMYFVSKVDNEHLEIGTYRQTVPPGQPNFTFQKVDLGSASFLDTVTPRQPGPQNVKVDTSLDNTIQSAAWRNNQLVVAQTIGTEIGGVTDDQVRWYQFSTVGATPVWQYYGTFGPARGVDSYHPSINIDASNNLGLTFMQSSRAKNGFPSVVVAVMPHSVFPDPPRPGAGPKRVVTRAKIVLVAKRGRAPLNNPGGTADDGSTIYRAGDYSATAIDPNRPNTFWSANEFATAANIENWGTWITAFHVK
jgi:hypothetical protein